MGEVVPRATHVCSCLTVRWPDGCGQGGGRRSGKPPACVRGTFAFPWVLAA